MKQSYEDLSAQLVTKNIRPSYQRVKLLEYLIYHRHHPSVEEIYTALHGEIPSLSKTTIYNTLNLFIKARLLRALRIEDNETRYDIEVENHGHFKCQCCGTIYNFSIDIERLESHELRNFQIKDRQVYFKGVCSKCSLDKKNN